MYVFVLRSCLILSQGFLSPVVIVLEILDLLWNLVPVSGCTPVLGSFLLLNFSLNLFMSLLNLNVLESQKNFKNFYENSLVLKKQNEIQSNWSLYLHFEKNNKAWMISRNGFCVVSGITNSSLHIYTLVFYYLFLLALLFHIEKNLWLNFEARDEISSHRARSRVGWECNRDTRFWS